jgi:hypothetical protein
VRAVELSREVEKENGQQEWEAVAETETAKWKWEIEVGWEDCGFCVMLHYAVSHVYLKLIFYYFL